MQIKVIDNFIDPLLCKAIYANLLRLPMIYDQSSHKEIIESEKDNRFFFSKMSEYDHVILYLFVKVKEFLKKDLKFLRAYANIQFKDQHSAWHTDDGDCTILLMISETLNDGKFEIGDHKIDFVQNRCIVFDAKENHRGLASEYAILPRCTIAIKTRI
tara:strand:- start:495 stop:968 length:474 start_codon:yes stop_codon:yes gene_type:complete